MKKLRKKGQSVLEYVLISTAVVGLIIVAAGGVVKKAVNQTITDSSSAMDAAAGKM